MSEPNNEKQIEEFHNIIDSLWIELKQCQWKEGKRVEFVNNLKELSSVFFTQALHNSPLLSYLRDKKKELEPLVFCKCGKKAGVDWEELTSCKKDKCNFSGYENDMRKYDFICELLNKFDK